jgi:putative ABC transport system permease protein
VLRNYLIVGLRALAKNKAYAFINIFGLSLGLAASILILSYVRYEFSYDAWMAGSDRAYELQTIFHATAAGGLSADSQTTAYMAGQALKKDFPQFDRVVYATGQNAIYIQNGQPTTTKATMLVDGPLFDILQVPFVRGDPVHALDDPHSLVISDTEAHNRYGNDNPIGRTLTVVSGTMKADYRVTGVFQDIPKNSSLAATIVVRIDPQLYFRDAQGQLTGAVKSWRWQNGQIFERIKPGVNVKDIEAQFPAWKKRNIPDDLGPGPKSNPGNEEDFRLVNIRDVHIGQSKGPAVTTDRMTVLTFAIVAFMILAMACINFTNLSTARASQRAREVALRKVLGANRRQLITQFIGESMLVSAIAMLIALTLTEFLLPLLNAFLDAQIKLTYFGANGVLVWAILLTLFVGLAGGVYPAFYLSRFEPARILRANKSSSNAEGNGRLRTLLVITQFSVSIGLISCTAVVYAQTVFERSVDAGYRRDGLIQIQGMARPQVESVANALLDEIKRQPNIVNAGRTDIGVATGNNSSTTIARPGSTDQVELGIYGLDPTTIDTLGMKVLAGRNLSRDIALDNATTLDFNAEKALAAHGANIILSESAAQRMGFHSPQAAIGQTLDVGLVRPELGTVKSTIVGVVSDVRYRTSRDPVQPTLYYYRTDSLNCLLIRSSGDPSEADRRVGAVWKRLVPDIPYVSRFVDDIVYQLYSADEKRAELFGMFAILAVVIGCLGLYGLAAFSAAQRTKEIGIRKVLGARTRDIVRLLVWQFSRPVLIANLLAWPVAWWVMRGWLQRFDAHVGLGPAPFLVAGGLALGIAIATIASHAIRVARANPILALRYE